MCNKSFLSVVNAIYFIGAEPAPFDMSPEKPKKVKMPEQVTDSS